MRKSKKEVHPSNSIQDSSDKANIVSNGGAVIEGDVSVDRNQGIVVFGKLTLSRFTLITTILVPIILAGVSFLVLGPVFQPVLEDKCILGQASGKEVQIAFLGLGAEQLHSEQDKLVLTSWKNQFLDELEQAANDQKDRSVGIITTKLDITSSEKDFRDCGAKLLTNAGQAEVTGLVSYLFLKNNSNELELSFQVGDQFLSSNSEIYASELSSVSELGAPLLLTENWRQSTGLDRGEISRQLKKRVAALISFRIGLYYMGKGDYNQAKANFDGSLEKLGDTLEGDKNTELGSNNLKADKTIELFSAWSLASREAAKSPEQRDFDPVRKAYQSIIDSPPGDKSCRAWLGESNVEYSALATYFQVNSKAQFNTEMLQPIQDNLNKAETCYTSLPTTEKITLEQAELPAKIKITRARLLLWTGYIDLRDCRGEADLDGASKLLNQITQDYKEHSRPSLKNLAANAYFYLGQIQVYYNRLAGQDSLPAALSYYREAVNYSSRELYSKALKSIEDQLAEKNNLASSNACFVKTL